MHVRPACLRLAAALVCAAVLAGCGDEPPDDRSGGSAPAVEADQDLAGQGEAIYRETCAECHGSDLKGTDSGPPFLDAIYAPDHHPDEAFYAAVENGVQPHHWEFGAMPPQPAIDADEVAAIVAFVRREQAEAGITEDPSH